MKCTRLLLLRLRQLVDYAIISASERNQTMKDWKTYAIIILAAWCGYLTFVTMKKAEPDVVDETQQHEVTLRRRVRGENNRQLHRPGMLNGSLKRTNGVGGRLMRRD